MNLRDLLDRVWRSRTWIVAWWVIALAVALAGGATVSAAAAAGMRGYVGAVDGHLLSAAFELLSEEPAVAAAIAGSVRAALLLGTVMWLLGTPIVYATLSGYRSVGAVATRTWTTFLPILVQTIYVGLIRSVVLLVVAFTPSDARLIAAICAAPLWLLSVAALDQARAIAAQRAQAGMPGRYSPRVVLEAARSMWGLPLRLVVASALWLLAVAWVPFAIYVAIHSAGAPAAVWALRVGSLLPLLLGFARIGLYATPQEEPARVA